MQVVPDHKPQRLFHAELIRNVNSMTWDWPFLIQNYLKTLKNQSTDF
jgi:hypothetical protein